jgi:plasmid stability protein
MAAVHIRDVPESVVSALRERADRHGHSMQQELRQILAAAAAEEPEVQQQPPLRLITAKFSSTSTWRREDLYGDEGR